MLRDDKFLIGKKAASAARTMTLPGFEDPASAARTAGKNGGGTRTANYALMGPSSEIGDLAVFDSSKPVKPSGHSEKQEALHFCLADSFWTLLSFSR